MGMLIGLSPMYMKKLELLSSFIEEYFIMVKEKPTQL